MALIAVYISAYSAGHHDADMEWSKKWVEREAQVINMLNGKK
jgi:hypothetical protein